MKDVSQAVFLNLVRAGLPKHVDPATVTLAPACESGGRARILCRGQLVSEWGYGVFGWMAVESAAYHSREAAAVECSAKRAARHLGPPVKS